MTELREPPLLSDEELFEHLSGFNHISTTRDEQTEMLRNLAQAERDICIKWMKGNCYLKAKREVPQAPVELIDAMVAQKLYRSPYVLAQQDMLKEVDGVSFKAVKGWD